MATSTFNLEFADHNSVRRYPLAITSEGNDQTDSFSLPLGLIVGLDLPVHVSRASDPSRFFVREIGWYTSGISATIGYDDPFTGPENAATVSFPTESHVPHRSYTMSGVGRFGDTVGSITIGQISSLAEQPSGQFIFDLEQTRLDPDVIRPMLRGITAVKISDASGSSRTLTGDIEFVAGANVALDLETDMDTGTVRIVVSGVNSEGFEEACECEDETSPPIYTINGVPPTSDGDLTLTSAACVQIESLNSGLQLSNTCAEPCCGSEELESITQRLRELEAGLPALNNFVNRLERTTESFNQVIIGSRLNPGACGL